MQLTGGSYRPPANLILRHLVFQDKGHFHHNSIFRDLALVYFYTLVFDPGTCNILQSFVSPGYTGGRGIVKAFA